MSKPMFDADALIAQFETASAKGAAQLRKTVADTTLAALQGRELTLKNVRSTVKAVAEAASAGAAKNVTPQLDPQTLLDQAVAGMDDAVLKAVDAHRTALDTLVTHGADLREKHLATAITELEKLEDTMFAALKKAAAGAGGPMEAAWGGVLEKMQAGGTASGAQAAATLEHLTEQMHGAVKTSRAASMRAAQALAESYTAMVSGVLLGMSEALQGQRKTRK
jgi:hypothetical protein